MCLLHNNTAPMHVWPVSARVLTVPCVLCALNEYESLMCICACRSLPVLAEVIQWWRRITDLVGVLNRHRQRRPSKQLLVLCQTAAECLTGSDGLQRDYERHKQTDKTGVDIWQTGDEVCVFQCVRWSQSKMSVGHCVIKVIAYWLL